MYPKLLKKGTIIQIGNRPRLNSRAIDMQFELSEDTVINSKGVSTSNKHKIIKNPNGWIAREVVCEVKLEFDKVISFSTNKKACFSTNKKASMFLDKEW